MIKPISPEAREMVTILLGMQKGVPLPENKHLIPTEGEEHLIEILMEVIEVMAAMLKDVADIAQVDLAASWQAAVTDFIEHYEGDDHDGC